jgi:hypothetical protein
MRRRSRSARCAGIAALAALLLGPVLAHAQEPAVQRPGLGRRVGYALATWIPNRVLDVFDIARARVRFGPGAASSFRFTRPVSGVAGSWSALWLGLPGPRGEPTPSWPIGFEDYPAPPPGFADSGGSAPYYGPGEIGAGFQLGFIGLDVGVDPVEAVDLAAGLFFYDVLGDDF